MSNDSVGLSVRALVQIDWPLLCDTRVVLYVASSVVLLKKEHLFCPNVGRAGGMAQEAESNIETETENE